MQIAQFTGGDAKTRAHLNQLVNAANKVQTFRGDSFIRITQGPTGYIHGLNIEALLPRIPKGAKQIGVCKITSNDGSGTYKITQLLWDGNSWQAVTAGIFETAARDFRNRDWAIASTEPVIFWHQSQEDGSDELVLNVGASGTNATPKDASYSGEHQEAVRAAGVVDFNRDVQGANDGYKTSLVTGSAYYDASDKTWYEHRIDLTFDSSGGLGTVSDEYREIVTTTEDCPSIPIDGGTW